MTNTETRPHVGDDVRVIANRFWLDARGTVERVWPAANSIDVRLYSVHDDSKGNPGELWTLRFDDVVETDPPKQSADAPGGLYLHGADYIIGAEANTPGSVSLYVDEAERGRKLSTHHFLTSADARELARRLTVAADAADALTS